VLILGISAYYHDSAAALIRDGNIVAAAQEERFSRLKFDNRFPHGAASYCLTAAGCTMKDIDQVAYYESTSLKLSRLLNTYADFAPQGYPSFRQFVRSWSSKAFTPRLLRRSLRELPGGDGWNGRLASVRHHRSHAASAFFPSPFQEANVVTVDGMGEWDTTTVGYGQGDRLTSLASIEFPHSLGMLYSAFTYYAGFRVNSDEYKLMGLAPYGEPKFADVIRREIIELKADGSYELNLDYFDFMVGKTVVNEKFFDLFGGPPRDRGAPVESRHADLAASVQAVTEEAMLGLVRSSIARTGSRNLCLAGGVALNCVANGKISRSGLIDNLWVQPAAGDAGGALGAALACYHDGGAERKVAAPDAMHASRLGPEFSRVEIKATLKSLGANVQVHDTEDALLSTVVKYIAAGQVVGWFDGRMEYGPRALGGRSILADPRNPEMQRKLNLKVKFRESFRPFAPIVLLEDAPKWFEVADESPYMLIVSPVRQDRRIYAPVEDSGVSLARLQAARSQVPAITHVDYSARLQTVDAIRQPRLYALLQKFKEKTGCPMLVNTSFNVADEPIVCTPADAYRCFMSTDIDALVVGPFFLAKKDQTATHNSPATAAPKFADIPEFNYTVF
jgi:carbamoyltransferase